MQRRPFKPFMRKVEISAQIMTRAQNRSFSTFPGNPRYFLTICFVFYDFPGMLSLDVIICRPSPTINWFCIHLDG